jgi:hypothetical protein
MRGDAGGWWRLPVFAHGARWLGDFGEASFDGCEDVGPVVFAQGGHGGEHADVVGAVAAVEDDGAFVEDVFAGVHDFLFVASEGREAHHAAEASDEAVGGIAKVSHDGRVCLRGSCWIRL